MTTASRIPADRGLTTRMFVTGLFLVILYAIFGAILWEVFRSFVILFVVIFGLLFAQYWFSDKIALWGMHGRIVTPEQAPQLHEMLAVAASPGGVPEQAGQQPGCAEEQEPEPGQRGKGGLIRQF